MNDPTQTVRVHLQRFVPDQRGMGGPGAGGALAVVLLVSTIGAGMAVETEVGASSDPGQHADVVAEGVVSSFADTNRDTIGERGPPTHAGPPEEVREAMPDEAWDDTPPGLKNAVARDVGGFLAEIRAQTGGQGELERVRPAGEGVVAGALVAQHGTESHTVTDERTVTTEVEKRVLDHREEYLVHYERVFDGWEKQKVGTENVTVGHTWEMEYVNVSYEVPVYETKTATRWTEETYTTTETETYYEKEYHCYDSNGHMNGPGGPTAGRQCRWDTVKKTRTIVEEHTRWVKETYTKKVVDHYETKYKWEKKPVKKEITETRPVYERKPTYTTTAVYDTRPVYKNVTETQTENKTVERTVSTGPFTHDSHGNWTIATSVSDLRDSSLRVEKTTLATNESRALTLEAVGEVSGETWTLRVWNASGSIVVATSTGINETVAAEAVRIDFENGTVNGDRVGVHVGAGLGGENVTLRFQNGDEARGTYTFVVAGTPAVGEQSMDPARDTAGVTVADDLVYAATFDVTVETSDGTYSERVTVEPAAPIHVAPKARDTGNGAGNGNECATSNRGCS